MGVSVVATALSDGRHLLVAGNMTTTVSFSLLILSKSTTDQKKDIVGISFGEMILVLGLDTGDH
jgi:hypothetical protein